MPPKKPAADSADPPQPTSSKALAEETTESKKPDAATLRKLTSHPPTTIMVREALKAVDSRKGVTSQAIQKYIKLKYPSADGVMLKHFVRRALIKGLETGTLARPPNSSVTSGAQGRFRLAPKKEPKPKSENTDPNVQKAPKVAKDGVKQSQKAGTTKKKNVANEEIKSAENMKTRKDDEAAPAKRPKAKKAEAEGSGEGSSDSSKRKAAKTKGPKTGKDSQSKAAKNMKPPRKDEEAAPAKRPKAKKAEAKGSGEGSSDSSKSKAAKTTKGPETGKDSQSKAAKAGGEAPVAKRGKKT